MNITEFNNEFDILYDNIADKSAPGLDLYEKSFYLTKAQLELIKTHYSTDNKYKQGFDGSQKRRVDIEQLIKNHVSENVIASINNISPHSKFFSIPSDVFLILQESALIHSNEDNCLQNEIVTVKPITYDEYNIQKKNPFKKPDKTIVWRLDFSKLDDFKVIELVSPYTINKYQLRYIKYPSPIILTNLDGGDFTGQGLSIDGKISPQTSELDQSFHAEILDRAVELAVRDYKESSLQNKVQLDLRNE